MSLRSAGKKDAENILKELAAGSPERATRIKKLRNASTRTQTPYSKEEALAYFLDAKHTVHTYNLTQSQAKQRNYK